ncbi:hypothetical protein [Halobacillus sp. BAB-2008]|uniref:hypothetical protein n=1 Tax=Halobacillus sp. BAB-2008 TaxID=1246484 RepID=UPI0002A4DF61|nr:hypothetical protein [Halobacillus sp. BAB-2008]ELK44849.1 hypothetical protein D479_17389 [Halobacillus sp. BAB-2008]
MGAITVVLVILLAVVVDFFWLDVDQRRWGWMKNWSKLQKGLFFAGFAAAALLIYAGLSLEYI